MGYGYYPRYVSVAEKKARAEKKIKQLQKKNPDIEPIILSGQALAVTWWGKAWNKNLERYADYTNRIGRGRSYVRHRAVVDLKISPGRVDALVQGTRRAPYKVGITISKIKKKNWQSIIKKCQDDLASLPDLLAGRFPKKMQDLFMVQGKGLFPTPAEISFECSCPDWASMCKHVAATLYGVGARLDEDPALFFTLRQVEMQELVAEAVQEKTDAIVTNNITGSRVIADDALTDLFGVEIDVDISLPGKEARKGEGKKKRQGKKKTQGATVKTKGKTGKKIINRKKAASPGSTGVAEVELPEGYGSATALVQGCIEEGGPEGISVQDLADITGIPRQRLYPILQRLKKQGRINSLQRGVYGP